LSLRRIDVVLTVGIKYSQVAVDEAESTTEPQSPHDDENKCSSHEQVVNRLPDIVRDVEGYLSSDGSVIRGISVDVGKNAQATWSKEVLSSGGIPEDELASTEPHSYWNINNKECSDGMIVTFNASYKNESDASSRSSLEDQFEGFSSFDNGCSKGQSSVVEPVDLSNTEPSVVAGKETAGSLELRDGNVEQVLTEPCDSFFTGRGMENATGTVTTSHMENQEIIEECDKALDGSSIEEIPHSSETMDATAGGLLIDSSGNSLAQTITSSDDKGHAQSVDTVKSKTTEESSREISQPTYVPPVELSSECCLVAGGEILQELDAYLNSALDDYHSADYDSLHVTTADAAATDDAVMKNSCCSSDVINVDGLAADMNDVEYIDETDLDQTESVTVHSSVEVPVSHAVKNLFRANNTSQVDNNNNVCVEANQLCGVDNTASFLRNQTAISIRQQLQQDFSTAVDPDKTDKVHEEAAAVDGAESIDLSESEKLSETTFGNEELPKFKTCDDALLSDCYSKAEMTELVGNDVEMADAEVDAIFSGAVCGLCIRRVSDDEADASDPGELSQTSDTSDPDDFMRCGVTRSVPVKERLELDTENDMYTTNETGTSETTGIILPCMCSSEVPDIEDQFERNGDGQDIQVEGDRNISQLLHRELQIIDYIVDECETESDQSSNDLEITLPAEPSDKVHEMWNEDEIANSEADTKSKTDEGRQEDDQAMAADCISSPGSDMSWRSCTSTVCESEKHTENNQLETVPSVRGITQSQVAAYSKFCEGRLNVTAPVDYSEKTVNTVPNEQQGEDYRNASLICDSELPPENLDSWVQHQLLNSISLLSEYHHYDFSGMESCGLQNKYAQMKVQKNEVVEKSFPVDEDLDEVNECSQDTDLDVMVTNFVPECSKPCTTSITLVTACVRVTVRLRNEYKRDVTGTCEKSHILA